MFYTYILQSLVDGSYYIGYTQNIEKRLLNHNKGLSKYTRRKIPWKVVYSEKYITKTKAIKRENEIKAWKSREKIKNLIKTGPVV